ncbi:uncharacterized protein LOC105440039 [Strongylocentrotus purpuratus]|uniref:Uncharacterized protein n=1 Tax=Strongylocentrotus purpuratus TaxID=7668 RepID=A0A7M7PGA5_STRPU|nr:uncharacterized protein LOC105440039 [Strongylocentrotus purpuratus]
MGTDVVDKTDWTEVPGCQLQITFMKAELASFSIFRYSVTASTAPGEGVTATTTDTCETPQGVPVEPDTIPSPSDNAISQTSFMTTLPPHDARNGPISCCEVIVVELQSGDADLDSSDPSYSPAQIMSYKEAQNTIGTPYSAVVFSNCPTDEVKVVIGATTDNSSTCYTGGSAGSASRRRRQTTSASTLTAVNGPLNTGGIYSTFVRVYTPSPEDPQMAFYESGPFMVPVTLKSSDTPVTLTIVSVIVILVLICVIMIFICIRKRKRSRQQGNRSSPIASASFTTTPRMCTDLLPANSPTSSGNQQVEDVYHEYERVCVSGQDSSKSSTRANQGTSQGISLTKTKSTSENDQSHDYENPSFDDKEYTDLDFSQVKKGGDPTKPTSSGKEYTDLDFSKIEKGGVPTKSFDGKEDVDPAYEVCII